ncbi:MAG: hypothetical protein A2902_02215 [Elusimicrobia bacterium RIFCSPLOWO2_01_FULL_64_13]|nr:MAG: hypothetical protein A2902_02215 [Elusimicrobia bacterium RIFCSPLOWO2_01_FULL_64_13]
MTLDSSFIWLGALAAAILPVWNIPLVIKIFRRRSSRDISLAWVTGVECCLLAMLPSAILSRDLVFKVFGIANAALFSVVFAVVWTFHRRGSDGPPQK